MKKLKLSPWHDGKIKPMHVGVYQSRREDWYRFWDGKHWYNGSIDKELAEHAHKILGISSFQDWEWRGIIK